MAQDGIKDKIQNVSEESKNLTNKVQNNGSESSKLSNIGDSIKETGHSVKEKLGDLKDKAGKKIEDLKHKDNNNKKANTPMINSESDDKGSIGDRIKHIVSSYTNKIKDVLHSKPDDAEKESNANVFK